MHSPQELAKIIDEIRGDKVVLICGKHNYVASRRRANGIVIVPPEPRGCAECQQVYFVTDYAFTTPSQRQERLDELEEVIHHTIEYEQKGHFGEDFQLYNPQDSRFRVSIEKDAADDETGEDKIIIPGEESLN